MPEAACSTAAAAARPLRSHHFVSRPRPPPPTHPPTHPPPTPHPTHPPHTHTHTYTYTLTHSTPPAPLGDPADYIKHSLTIAQSATFLAWGAIDFSAGHSTAGQAGYARAAVKWAADYLRACHLAPDRFVGLIGNPGKAGGPLEETKLAAFRPHTRCQPVRGSPFQALRLGLSWGVPCPPGLNALHPRP